jgi:hypothetical protein
VEGELVLGEGGLEGGGGGEEPLLEGLEDELGGELLGGVVQAGLAQFRILPGVGVDGLLLGGGRHDPLGDLHIVHEIVLSATGPLVDADSPRPRSIGLLCCIPHRTNRHESLPSARIQFSIGMLAWGRAKCGLHKQQLPE